MNNESEVTEDLIKGCNTTVLSVNYSNSNDSPINEYVPYNERPEVYLVPILFILIFVIGVIGNGTLVVIILRQKTMRNVPNTYILSLALGDLLVIITVPFTFLIYTLESWPWGELTCKLSEAAKVIFVGVSVFTLTALSADRFFAIVNPLKKLHATGQSRKSTRLTIGIAISIWIFAMLWAVPTAIGAHVESFSYDNISFNALNHQYPKIAVLTKFLIIYLIPLAVIAVFYLKMANYLIISTKNIPGEVQGTERQIRGRKKTAITVLIMVLTFAVCLLPSHVFRLFFYIHPNSEEYYNDFWHYSNVIGFCLLYLNSCANPVALYFVSGKFRKHFNRYLFCVKPKRTSHTSMPIMSTGTDSSTNKNQQEVDAEGVTHQQLSG